MRVRVRVYLLGVVHAVESVDVKGFTLKQRTADVRAAGVEPAAISLQLPCGGRSPLLFLQLKMSA